MTCVKWILGKLPGDPNKSHQKHDNNEDDEEDDEHDDDSDDDESISLTIGAFRIN